MLVNHDYRFVCISVPKTGSTSLHYALLSHLNIQFEVKDKAPSIYHLNAEDIAKIMGPHKFASYFSFGVTRNPYDRMVSLYHDFRDQRGAIKVNNFDEFVVSQFPKYWQNNIHFLPQTFFLCRGAQVAVTKTYRYEDTLEAALDDIGARLGFKFESVEHSRKSRRRPWQEYFANPKVVEAVNEAFAEDFKTFGYEMITKTPASPASESV